MRSLPTMHRQPRSIVAIGFVVALMLAVAGPVPAARAAGGDPLWVARYNGSGNGYDTATALAVSPDGARVYVTGNSHQTGAASPSDDDFATVAYDAETGAKLWVRTYNGPGNGDDRAETLAVSPDGARVYVTGRSIGSQSSWDYPTYDYATVAYDAVTGAQVWTGRYNGPGNADDFAQALAVSPDGAKVYVTGESFGTGTLMNEDYATVAYDAITGVGLWARRYNGPGNGYDAALALAVSPSGAAIYVSGESIGSDGNYDFATLTYDAATGARMWMHRYSAAGWESSVATALAVSPDGARLYVTGFTYVFGVNADYATVAYDAISGAEIWVRGYDGPGSFHGSDDDAALAVAVSPDGSRVYVTGQSVAAVTNNDYATVAYDAATGAKVWIRRYSGPRGNDYGRDYDLAEALALSPDGARVYVTGRSFGSRISEEYATVAYDAATGAKVWVRRYNGPGGAGDDLAYALAVSPDNATLYVTGQSYGSRTTFTDYATIAYRTG